MQTLIDKQTRLQTFLDHDPDNFSLLADLLECACQLQDEEQAEHFLERALKIDGGQALALEGLFHLSFNRPEKAITSLEEALAFDDIPAVRHNLSFCYLYLGNADLAATILEPMLPFAAEMPQVLLLMARIQHHLGQLEDACYFGEQYLSQAPENDEVLGLLALVYFDLENIPLAEQFAQRARLLNQNNDDALSVSTLIDLHQGKIDLPQLEAICEQMPYDVRLLWALGQGYLVHQSFEQAVDTIGQVCALAPEFLDARISHAFALIIINRLTEAEAQFQSVLDDNREHADALGGLALVAVLKQAGQKADSLIKQACFLEADNGLAHLAKSLLTCNHNPDEAKAILYQSLETMLAESGLQFGSDTEAMLNKETRKTRH